jgi:hypothetical protein
MLFRRGRYHFDNGDYQIDNGSYASGWMCMKNRQSGRAISLAGVPDGIFFTLILIAGLPT